MLKLIKYEFRKSMGAFWALLGVAAAVEAYFLISLRAGKDDHVAVSMLLLFLCASALTLYSLIRGVTAYSGELGRRSSYLLFMTPNSCLKIVASKFLFTFVNGLFFAALIVGAMALDMRLFEQTYGEWTGYWSMMQTMLAVQGVPFQQMLTNLGFSVLYLFVEFLAEVGLAYVAVTLSYTLFRDKKWRWLPSIALFLLLSWGVSALCGLFPSPADNLTILFQAQLTGETIPESVARSAARDLIPAMAPTALISLGAILVSLFGCAALLKKKVSL